MTAAFIDIEKIQVTAEWDKLANLSWDEILDLETEYGRPIRSFRMQNGKHLVFKIEIETMTSGHGLSEGPEPDGVPIALPQNAVRRSVGNLVAIRGFVVAASEPYVSKHAKKINKLEWDDRLKQAKPIWRWEAHSGGWANSSVMAGDAIIWNSYNCGVIRLHPRHGFVDPLVIVREEDIECTFSKDDLKRVDIGDWALTYGSSS